MIGPGGGGSGDTSKLESDIGNKTDFVGVPYVFGDNPVLAHLNTSYYHIHGQPFCYPAIASSILITSGAGAWGTGGSITEIVPENELDVSTFDLHWINIINHSADAEYYIEIYSGASGSETLIGSTRSWRESSFLGGQVGNTTKRIQIPQQSANTRISCKLYSSNAATASVEISFEGHYYA